MKSKTIMAFAAVLAVGNALLLLGRRQEAQGQREDKAPAWEFKVVSTAPDFSAYEKAKDDNELFKLAAEGLGKEYNKLGAEGWEYVGPVFTQARTKTDPYRALVVFKRLKK